MEVTITPSNTAATAARFETTVTDSAGRSIGIKEPDFLAQFRLIEILGRSAENQQYVNMVRPVLYVCSIDGVSVAPPHSKSEVEALITRLGPSGYNALAAALLARVSDDENATNELKK